MDVLSSTGILTPDIRLVTSFESTHVAPGSDSLFCSHLSERYRRKCFTGCPSMYTAKSGCRNSDIRPKHPCIELRKPVTVRHTSVTKATTTNCTMVARFLAAVNFSVRPFRTQHNIPRVSETLKGE